MNHQKTTEFLNTREAASLLSLKKNTLEIWRVQGRGPAFVRLGRAIRYRIGDLENFVQKQTVQSTSERN